MQKDNKASLSIFLAIVMVLIVSLLVTLIEHVRVTSSIATMDMIASLAVTSAFANFDRDTFEEYGILTLTDKETDMASAIIKYAEDNVECENPFLRVKLKNVTVDSTKKLTFMNGALAEKQIFDYMKYAAPVGIGMDIINMFKGNVDNNPVKEVVEDISELSERISTVPEEMYALATYIEGVITYGEGIEINDGRVMTNEHFAKMISNDTSMNGLGIDREDIYAGIKENIYNPSNDLKTIKDAAFKALEYEDFKEVENARFLLTYYIQRVNICIEYYNKAIETADKLKAYSDDIDKSLSDTTSKLEKYKDILDEESYKALREEVEGFEGIVGDVDELLSTLIRNREQLQSTLAIQNIDFNKLSDDDIQTISDAIDMIKLLNVSDIRIDYRGLLTTDNTDTDPLGQLSKIYKLGVLDLVADNISDKKISPIFNNNAESEAPYSGVEGLMRNAVFSEYILNKFNSHIDGKSGNPLDYEAEYIMYGNCSDRENLSCAVDDIIKVREAANLLYLFTDTDKMNEAYAMALVLTGGTAGAVRIVQLGILTIWAYGEAIIDTRTLLRAKRIDFYKRKDTWVLSIDNLFKFDLSGEVKESKLGNDYEDYLKYGMINVNYGKKNMGFLNMLSMIKSKNGEIDYRPSAIIVAGTVTFEFEYMGNRYYSKTIDYLY